MGRWWLVLLALLSIWWCAPAFGVDAECDPDLIEEGVVVTTDVQFGFIPVCSAPSNLALTFCRYTFALPDGTYHSINLQAPVPQAKHVLSFPPEFLRFPAGTEIWYSAWCASIAGSGSPNAGRLRIPGLPPQPVILP